MAYLIEQAEPIPTAIRRIMAEQIDRASEQLADESSGFGDRIHNARKRFKEIRALLRLVRGPLGEDFAAENEWFRDAGRDLSAVRDVEAVLESLEKLRGEIDSPEGRGALEHAERVLSRRRDATQTADLADRIASLAAQLPLAKSRLDGWQLDSDRFATIGEGLERAYRGGRRAFRRVQKDPRPENIHEWRKRAKDQWYQMQLLSDVWSPMLRRSAEVLHDLSDLLGDHHDLTVLGEIVAGEPDELGGEASVKLLLSAIDSRRAELEREASRIGRRVYAEAPGPWRRRMRGYWRAWREEGSGPAEAASAPEQERRTRRAPSPRAERVAKPRIRASRKRLTTS